MEKSLSRSIHVKAKAKIEENKNKGFWADSCVRMNNPACA